MEVYAGLSFMFFVVFLVVKSLVMALSYYPRIEKVSLVADIFQVSVGVFFVLSFIFTYYEVFK